MNNKVTLASSHNVAFDWNKALSKKPSDYSEDQREELLAKAAEWTTCACGNQCSIIPRGEYNNPLDPELNSLGMDFADDVQNANEDYALKCGNSYANARKTLAKIEKRSITLIKQEQDKLLHQLAINQQEIADIKQKLKDSGLTV